MKRLFVAAAVSTIVGAPSALAAVDVGVSVQVSQPGVYGRIDIGSFPQPQVVVAQPVLVTPLPPPRVRYVVPPPQPVYMWVPPGHQRDWAKHCGRYNACGVPVYFVRDDWYHNTVYPQGKGGKGGGKGKGKGKGHGDD
jgi:hypothetical protein